MASSPRLGRSSVVAAFVLAAAALVHCTGAGTTTGQSAGQPQGAGGEGGAGGESPEGGSGGGVSAGQAGSGAGGGASGSSGVGGGVDVGPALDVGCPPCSADMRDVLDCDGHVVKTCEPNEACLDGACMADPCGVAAKAKTSYGCDFYALNVGAPVAGGCFATYVTNNWPSPVKIQVEYKGMTLPVGQFARIPSGQGASLKLDPYNEAEGLAPGQVAILFLSQIPGAAPPLGVPCPPGITTAINTESALINPIGLPVTGVSAAFHIKTDLPVAAYEISPFGGGAAARTYSTLLLPTGAWDMNYVAVNTTGQLAPTVAIVASEDDTTVTINPVKGITGGPGVPGTPAGKPGSYKLQKGQYLQFAELMNEFTGSPIQADKPVGVFAGNPCINVEGCCCDASGQQLPPVKVLGHEYAAVRYRGRNGNDQESVPWQMMGVANGTQLQYAPAPPPGAPATLGLGEMVQFDAPGPFLVRSQDEAHPFYMATYMTGGDNAGGEGDPEWVPVVPTEQYMNSYTFFTDPTYPETDLVLVRRPGHQGFVDVNLDCLGTVTGWQPLGPYEFTRVDLVTGNFQNVGNCSNGAHVMKSDVPFGVTVWGWGSSKTGGNGLSEPNYSQYVSYGYPAGMRLSQINGTVVTVDPK